MDSTNEETPDGVAVPMRVLLVEDQATDAELTLYELKRHGLNVDSHRVWQEADLIEALGEFNPDVILSDYSMPAMDGLRSLELARTRSPEVPFLFVSGTIGEERATHALKNGAVDYVLKTNMARLGPAVERAVREAREHRDHQRMEAARRRLAAILETTPDFVGICDMALKLQYLNRGGLALLRVDGALPAQGMPADAYLPEALRNTLMQDAIPYATHNGTWEGEADLIAHDGSHIPTSLMLIVHAGEGKQVEFVSLIARDLRERKGYESHIRYLANFDALTDLPNRALLHDRALQAINHCRRTGDSLALMLIDIDRFALVNEGYGQATGDRLLKEIASRITCAVPADATVARMSADTFAVLASDLPRPDDALVLATGLADAINQPMLMDDRELQVSATIGITLFPRDGDTLDSLLRNAESALSRAKHNHRGGIQFYNAEMTDLAIERIEAEASVRSALRRGELELFYQPQFDVLSRQVIGVEALIRWRHPKRGLLSPAQLIPVAEEIGVIGAIGAWALEQACMQVIEWDRLGAFPIRIGVNVSPHQLQSEGFVELVQKVLAQSGLPPARLELEITESALMADVAESTRVLKRLKSLGVSIAVDDFGTGYSSLAYLSRFPIDRLKVDQSFVSRMSEDQHDHEIVQAVLSLARALKLSVIAEGVETEAQLRMLAASGCGEAQGYLVGRPVPPDGMMAFLRPRRKPG